MEVKINPVHLAAARFQQADDAWSKELRHVFGRDAGQARYERRGRGWPGTQLAVLHYYREMERVSWEVATGLKADTE